MSIQSGKVQEKDSVSIIRDKLKESPDFVDFLKKVDIVAVEYTRKNLSNTEHAARVGGGEIKAIKDKTQQFINTALLYFKKKLATEATQRASNDEQRVA